MLLQIEDVEFEE